MKNEMVFMMGLPASGKSGTRDKMFPGYTPIDSDLFKMSHPEYDPKNPSILHEWSAKEAEKAFYAALAAAKGQWVVDGTGSNSEKMVRQMEQAKAMGFTIRLVYVVVSLQTSLERNAKRTRVVPESVIREKAQNIATSFQIVAPHADEVQVINND